MAQDTAQFKITGVFDSETLINSVNATFGRVRKIVETEMGKAAGAINTQVGGALNASTKEAAKNIKGVDTPGGNAPPGIKKTKNEMSKINADLLIAAKRVILWGAASRLVYDSIQRIQDSFKNIIELNRILVNIQKIRPAGLPTFDIRSNILKTAQQYGIAFQEIGETQRTFFQAGFSVNEVLKLTQAQLLGVTAAGLTAEESIELLIGSMAVFNISAEKSITLLDKLQNVQANYAVTTQDLAQAIRRVGPVVEQLGGNIDSLIGIITALKESTRKSGEFIGTALSTIFSRIYTDIGKNTLRRFGIDVNETAIMLKPLENILGLVANKWSELTDQEKINLAFALGRRRRYAQVIALMDNYSTAVEAAADSASSFGAAVRAQQIEVQSISRQFAIAGQQAQETAMAIIGAFSETGQADDALLNLAKSVQGFISSVRENKEEIANFAKRLAQLGTVTLFATTLGLAGKRLYFMGKALKSVILTFGLFSQGVGKLIVGMVSYRTIADQASVATARFGVALAYAKANIGSLLVGIGSLVGVFYALKTLSSIDNVFKNQTEGYSELTGVFKDFETLSDNAKDTLKEYLAVAKQFKEFKGPKNLTDFLGVDRQGTSLNSVVGILKNMTGVAEDLSNVSLDQFTDALKQVRGETVNTNEAIEDLANIIGFFKSTQKGLANEIDKFQGEMTNLGGSFLAIADNINRLQETGNLFGGEQFIQQLFGKNPTEIIDELRQSLKLIGQVKIKPDEKVTPEDLGLDIKKISDALYKMAIASDGEFKRMVDQAGESGKLAAKSFVDAFVANYVITGTKKEFEQQVIKGGTGGSAITYRQIVRPVLDIKPNIDVKEVTRIFAEQVRQAFDPAIIQERFNELYKTQTLDLTKLLVGEGTDRELQTAVNYLTTTMGEVLPAIFDKLRKQTQPLRYELEKLYARLRETSKVIREYPTAVSPTLKAINQFNSEVGIFSSTLGTAAEKARAFGKSLVPAQLAAYRDQLNKAFEVLGNAEAIDRQIAANEKLLSVYRGYAKAITSSQESFEVLGIKLEDVNKIYDDLSQKTINLRHDQEESAIQVKKLRDIIETLAISYTSLQTKIINIEAAYKRQVALLKLQKSTITENAQAVIEYGNKLNEINTAFSKLGSESNLGSQLSDELRSIESISELEREIINRRIEAAKQYASLQQQALTNRERALNSEQASVDAANSVVAAQSGITFEIEKQRKAAQTASDVELATLDAEKERLDIEVQKSKQLAIQQTLLEAAKREQKYINSLASDYAKATSDIIGNIQKVITERGGLRTVLEPFGQAYVDSVSSRLADSLESIFKGIAGNTIGDQIDDLKRAYKASQEKTAAIQAAEIMKADMIEGGTVAGQNIAAEIINGLNALSFEKFDSLKIDSNSISDVGSTISNALSEGAISIESALRTQVQELLDQFSITNIDISTDEGLNRAIEAIRTQVASGIDSGVANLVSASDVLSVKIIDAGKELENSIYNAIVRAGDALKVTVETPVAQVSPEFYTIGNPITQSGVIAGQEIANSITTAIKASKIDVAVPKIDVGPGLESLSEAIMEAGSFVARTIYESIYDAVNSANFAVKVPDIKVGPEVYEIGDSIISAGSLVAETMYNTIVEAAKSVRLTIESPEIAVDPNLLSLDDQLLAAGNTVANELIRALILAADSVEIRVATPPTLNIDEEIARLGSVLVSGGNLAAQSLASAIVSSIRTIKVAVENPTLSSGTIYTDIESAILTSGSIVAETWYDTIVSAASSIKIAVGNVPELSISNEINQIGISMAEASEIVANTISSEILKTINSIQVAVEEPEITAGPVLSNLGNIIIGAGNALADSVYNSIIRAANSVSIGVDQPPNLNIDAEINRIGVTLVDAGNLAAQSLASAIVSSIRTIKVAVENPILSSGTIYTDIETSMLNSGSVVAETWYDTIISAANSIEIAVGEIPELSISREINQIGMSITGASEVAADTISSAILAAINSIQVAVESPELTAGPAISNLGNIIIGAGNTLADSIYNSIIRAANSVSIGVDQPPNLNIDDEINRIGVTLVDSGNLAAQSLSSAIVQAIRSITVQVEDPVLKAGPTLSNLDDILLSAGTNVSHTFYDSILRASQDAMIDVKVPVIDLGDSIAQIGSTFEAAGQLVSANIATAIRQVISSIKVSVKDPTLLAGPIVANLQDSFIRAGNIAAQTIYEKIISGVQSSIVTVEVPSVKLDDSVTSIGRTIINSTDIAAQTLYTAIIDAVRSVKVPVEDPVLTAGPVVANLNDAFLDSGTIVAQVFYNTILRAARNAQIRIQAPEAKIDPNLLKLDESLMSAGSLVAQTIYNSIISAAEAIDIVAEVPDTQVDPAFLAVGKTISDAGAYVSEVISTAIINAINSTVVKVENPLLQVDPSVYMIDDEIINAGGIAAEAMKQAIISAANSLQITVIPPEVESDPRLYRVGSSIAAAGAVAADRISAANPSVYSEPVIVNQASMEAAMTSASEILYAKMAEGGEYVGQVIATYMKDAIPNVDTAAVSPITEPAFINSLQEAAQTIKRHIISGGDDAGKVIAEYMRGAISGTQTTVAPAITGGTKGTEVLTPKTAQHSFALALFPVNSLLTSLGNTNKDQVDTQEKTYEANIKNLERQQRIISAIQGLGLIIGNIAGSGSQEGQIGSALGGIAGSFLSPIGGAIGSVLGGLIGGLFGGGEEEQPTPTPPHIFETNTNALQQNTEALIKNTQNFEFMRKLVNAPANFVTPAYATFGGGAPTTIEVNINAPVGNEQAVGRAVYDSISKVYNDNRRRIGRRG